VPAAVVVARAGIVAIGRIRTRIERLVLSGHTGAAV
jgi:hypothetical protein